MKGNIEWLPDDLWYVRRYLPPAPSSALCRRVRKSTTCCSVLRNHINPNQEIQILCNDQTGAKQIKKAGQLFLRLCSGVVFGVWSGSGIRDWPGNWYGWRSLPPAVAPLSANSLRHRPGQSRPVAPAGATNHWSRGSPASCPPVGLSVTTGKAATLISGIDCLSFTWTCFRHHCEKPPGWQTERPPGVFLPK